MNLHIHLMEISFTLIAFSLIVAFTCSVNWIYTGIALALSPFASITYYYFKFNYFEYIIAVIFFAIVGTLTYACYVFEQREKMNIIQMENIKLMNEELKNILMNLPEGVVLVNNSN
jgi:energy-converting hydrogenase Eha subunit H